MPEDVAVTDQEHDGWFRRQVEDAVREADAPNVARIPHEQLAENWRRHRAALAEKARRKAG